MMFFEILITAMGVSALIGLWIVIAMVILTWRDF